MSTRKGFARVVAKTADYTVTAARDSNGTVFTNRGASGTVIFTLPPPSSVYAGWNYDFRAYADQTITVKTTTADTLVALNDIAADSVSAQTGSAIIGAFIQAFCDGTSWFVNVLSVGTTQTVAS